MSAVFTGKNWLIYQDRPHIKYQTKQLHVHKTDTSTHMSGWFVLVWLGDHQGRPSAQL